MSQKLWQKSGKSDKVGAQNSGAKLHPVIEKYTVGKDFVHDNILLPYDIRASLAHAEMLKKIGILTGKEFSEIEKGLKEILHKWKNGAFRVTAEDEDMHTAIESYLTEKFGNVGKKIHTGRSRNDQIQAVMHLYMKDGLKEVLGLIDGVIAAMRVFEKLHGSLKMPGYTHMQRAMPMNISMWILTHVASLEDDKKLLAAAAKIIDQNPLGSAAGFGTGSLQLDRGLTTKMLGFEKIMMPELYCQNARTKFAALILSSLTQVMISLGKMANDLLLFTTEEFGFFVIDDAIATGSSIMPQKKNFDAFEILRGNVNVVMSHEFRVKNLGLPLISGYNRDFQLTKEPVMESFSITCESLEVCAVVFSHIKPDGAKMKAALTDNIYATEKVYELVHRGMPFRDAYRKVKMELNLR